MASASILELEQALKDLDLSIPIPAFTSADVINKPLDLFRSYLADIFGSLVDCDPAVAYNSVQLSNDPFQGDLKIVLPRLCPGAKPAAVAEDLRKRYPLNPLFDLPWLEGVSLCVVIKPGILPRILLPYIINRRDSYGCDPKVGLGDASSAYAIKKKVVVEFSSPNIATEFQGKHLRSTILGAFASRVYKLMGWDVTNVNYLGDWGKDLALFCVGWQKFGSEEQYEKDASAHVFDVYQKIHELFLPEQTAYKSARDEAKKNGKDELEVETEFENQGLHAERNALFKNVEEGDEQSAALFQRVRDLKIREYANFYARLHASFDEYSGESKVSAEVIAEVERLLGERGISEESEGKSVIDMRRFGAKTGMAKIRERAGGSTYFLRYLAAVLERYRKQNFDKMLFIAADRTGHFSRLIKVFEAMGMDELASKLQPVIFSDLSHMAEQLGHNYQPQKILDDCEKGVVDSLTANEAKARQLGSWENLSRILAVSSLLAQESSTKRASDHIFDISTMSSFKPGTGIDLQYQHGRLYRFLENHPYNTDLVLEDCSPLTQENHTTLLLLLGQYPETVHTAYESLEPLHIITYLRNVVEQLSDFLDDEENHDGEEETTDGEVSNQPAEGKDDSDPALIALYEAVRIVLENGLRLLGITPIAHVEQLRVDTPVAE